MQLHTNLVLSTGGLLALDKCKFYYIKFKFNKYGDPYIANIEDSPGKMMVANGFSSEKIEIKRMESSTAHRTLGYFISPEGNYDVQINNLVEMAQQWSTKIQLSNLTG